MRRAALAAAAWALAAGAGGAVAADEIDDLAAELKPPARFAGYRADFRVEERTFTFQQAAGPEEKRWHVVRDGPKYVALVRSGDFNLLAPAPDRARATLDMPAGRYHLDTQLGPTLCTHQFLKPVRTHGAIYDEADLAPEDEWTGGGGSLTLLRRLRTDAQVTEHRFVVRVDPVFGYRIDGHYDVRFKDPPAGLTWVGPTFCPGCYVPWPEQRVYDRTVHCPGGGGYRGWANNLLCMDRADAGRAACTWRDGGFIAYLDPRTLWSVVRTRSDGGGTVAMPVCNAHNDFHVHIPVPADLPRDERGWHHFKALHRLMGLPPELTRHVWDRVDLIQKGAKGIFIYIGEPCDFEDQPRDLADPVRGLCWTSGAPALSTDEARSGRQSLRLTKTSWPNLPQVSLKANARYRLEAWLKVEGEGARAFVRGDFYEWSPHSRQWLREQQSSAVAAGQGWQRSVLEFDTPAWDPFINIVFVVEGGGVAYLDDFCLVEVPAAR